VVAGELFGLIPVVTTIALGYAIFGLQLTSTPALGTAALGVATTMVSMSVLATLFAGISVLTEEPSDASILVNPFILFFAGLVFPISVLPAQAQWIAWCLPSTYGVDITRKALLLGVGLDNPQIQLEFVKMIAITLLLLPVGYLTFRWSIRRAERRGSLEAG
jgi:ABC-type polysaccharide/polyol phosphate export permease